MAELTRLNNQPIFQPQQVSSEAKGYDALGQIFGQVGTMVKEEGIKILDEQSKAAMLQSRNAMNDAVVKAKIDMINSPDLAGKIEQDTNDMISNIASTAMVHNTHRSILDSEAKSYQNQIKLLSADTQHRQLMASTRYKIGVEAPKTIKNIDDLYRSGNIKQAHQAQDNFAQTLNDALKIGAIPLSTYQNLNNAIQQTTVRAQQVMDMAKNGGTAAQYHEASNSIFGSNTVDQSTMPSNEYTSANYAHYSLEQTKQKALSDVYSYGHLVDTHEVDNLSQKDIDNIHMQWMGANLAKSHIQSNTNEILLQQRFNYLKNKTGLSLQETGELNYLKNRYQRLADGDFLNEVKNTSQGQMIYKQSMLGKRVIENSEDIPAEQKPYLLMKNEMEEKQGYLNLWTALHGDNRYVNLFTQAEMAPVKQAFTLGENPELAIQKINTTPKELLPYMAESMGNGKQRFIVSVIGQAGNAISQGFPADMIYANQQGFQSKTLQPDKEINTRKKMEGLIYTDASVSDALNYISHLPFDPTLEKEKGYSPASSAIESMTNYVLYQGDKNADFNLTNSQGYVSLLSSNIKKSYDIYQSNNMMFNRSTLNLEDSDLNDVGHYVLNQAYQKIADETGKDRDLAYRDLVDRQPLMVINLPNNVITVIDSATRQQVLGKDGRPIFEEQFTRNLLHSANDYAQTLPVKPAVYPLHFM